MKITVEADTPQEVQIEFCTMLALVGDKMTSQAKLYKKKKEQDDQVARANQMYMAAKMIAEVEVKPKKKENGSSYKLIETSGMKRTKLYTKEGEYVVTVLVPPFNPPSEVVIWGIRIFVRNVDGEYREGFSYSAVHDVKDPEDDE